MFAAQERCAEGHEVRDGVCAIADEFVQDGSDQGEGFSVVEANSTCKAALGESAGLGYEEFVDLVWGKGQRGIPWEDGVVGCTSFGDRCIFAG